MSKTLALVCLTLLWFAHFLLTSILMTPYGMAEPGRQRDAGWAVFTCGTLMFRIVERAWQSVLTSRSQRA